jgi:L-methionine (R)-S-oxide reductase
VPIIDKEGNLVGVFDLDSPNLSQFDEEDQVGLEKIVESLVKNSVWDICKTK